MFNQTFSLHENCLALFPGKKMTSTVPLATTVPSHLKTSLTGGKTIIIVSIQLYIISVTWKIINQEMRWYAKYTGLLGRRHVPREWTWTVSWSDIFDCKVTIISTWVPHDNRDLGWDFNYLSRLTPARVEPQLWCGTKTCVPSAAPGGSSERLHHGNHPRQGSKAATLTA